MLLWVGIEEGGSRRPDWFDRISDGYYTCLGLAAESLFIAVISAARPRYSVSVTVRR